MTFYKYLHRFRNLSKNEIFFFNIRFLPFSPVSYTWICEKQHIFIIIIEDQIFQRNLDLEDLIIICILECAVQTSQVIAHLRRFCFSYIRHVLFSNEQNTVKTNGSKDNI